MNRGIEIEYHLPTIWNIKMMKTQNRKKLIIKCEKLMSEIAKLKIENKNLREDVDRLNGNVSKQLPGWLKNE